MEQNTCEICWDEVKPSELFITGCKPVGHKFHIECIKINYKIFKKKECPMCRKSLNININNLYPTCKYILNKGLNKGKNCSKKGKNEGYCNQHKNKIDLEQNNIANDTGLLEQNAGHIQTNCEAITKKGTNCKNKSKLVITKDGQTIHVCGIHKNYIPHEQLNNVSIEVVVSPV